MSLCLPRKTAPQLHSSKPHPPPPRDRGQRAPAELFFEVAEDAERAAWFSWGAGAEARGMEMGGHFRRRAVCLSIRDRVTCS